MAHGDHLHARAGIRPVMTLVELLIVVAVLCVLASLLLPQLKSALERSRRTRCASNQRQMYAGWVSFANDHADRMPAREFWGGNHCPITNNTAAAGPFRRWMVQYAGVGKWMYWDTNNYTRDIRDPLDPNDSDAAAGDYKPFPKTRSHVVYCPSADLNWDQFMAVYRAGGPASPDPKMLSYVFYGLGVFYYGNMSSWAGGSAGYEQVGSPQFERLAAGMGGRRFLFLGDMTSGLLYGTWRHWLNHGDQGGNFTDATGVTRWHDMYFPWGDPRNDPDWLGGSGGMCFPKTGYAVQDIADWEKDLMIKVDGNVSPLSLDDKLRALGYRRSAWSPTRTTPVPW